MIINFKIFEEMAYIPNRYWKVRAEEPYFSISLEKLGVPEDRFKGILDDYRDHEYVFIYACEKFNQKWEYNFVDKRKIERDEDGKYMGEVEITENDLEEWKMKNDAKKYNL